MTKTLQCCAALALILAPANAGASPTAPAKTKIVVVDAHKVAVTSTVSGSCWTNSIATRRADAYRCMNGNAIHDPCFELDARSVACPDYAKSPAALKISLTKPLPPPAGKHANDPWMMRLAGEVTCNRGTGTVIPDYPFYCSGGIVCGSPSSTQHPAIFVACGKPKNGMSVISSSKYLVRVLYE